MPDWVASKLNILLSFLSSGAENVTWLPEMYFTTLLFKEVLALCPSVTRFMRFWLSGSVLMLLPRMRGPT